MKKLILLSLLVFNSAFAQEGSSQIHRERIFEGSYNGTATCITSNTRTRGHNFWEHQNDRMIIQRVSAPGAIRYEVYKSRQNQDYRLVFTCDNVSID